MSGPLPSTMKLPGQGRRARERVGPGRDLVDEADCAGFLRVDGAATEDELDRFDQPVDAVPLLEEPGQSLRAAVPRQEVQVDLGLAEARRRLGDAVVRRHLELVAAAERDAVDGGDDRLAHALELSRDLCGLVAERQHVLLRVHLLEQLADVGACHERLRARARDDDDLDVLATREVLDDGVQLVERALVERVDGRLRDREHGDRIARPHLVHLEAQRRVQGQQLLLVFERRARLPLADRARHLVQGLGVAERRRVAERLALEQVLEEPPHVLPAARLGDL